MRSFLLASIAALAFPACVQDIAGGSGTGTGDDTTAVCGNGTTEAGEACDDGNTAAGDGCSATCQNESTSAARVDATVDKATIATSLNSTETLNLSVTSTNGFTGTVTIAAAATNAKIAVTASPTVELTAGQTAVVPVSLNIPSDTTGADLADTLTLTLTSSAGTATATSALTVSAVFLVDYADGTGTSPTNHKYAGMTFTVKKGAILRFKNDDTSVAAKNHVIHADAPFIHQDPRNDPATQVVGDTYEIPTANLNPGTATIGCHSHGAASYATYTLVN